MIVDVVTALIAAIVNIAMLVALPSTARCPERWSVEGVRPDGAYACLAPLPACCGDAKGPCEAIACPTVERRVGRIYCTNGQRPIVIDHRTTGCQAR